MISGSTSSSDTSWSIQGKLEPGTLNENLEHFIFFSVLSSSFHRVDKTLLRPELLLKSV